MIISAINRDYRRVVDANGNDIRYCVEADTETGVCVVIEAGPDGLPIVDAVEGEFRLRKVAVTHPAPLSYEKYHA